MSAIFISHSSHDNAAAAAVRRRLEEQGHRSIFLDFDPADGIPAGHSWEQELYARLRACQAILVLCSEHSMASDWCFAEITHARSLGKHVFPIKIAPCEVRSLLTDLQVIDLTEDPEDAYSRLWRGLEIAGLDPKNVFDWDGSRPPYPGLLAFQEDDAAIFFGRDAEVRAGQALLRRLERFGGARWTLVLGASGSGKSSLVRAGILPRLRRDREAWLPVRPFRPLGQPFRELAKALVDTFEELGSVRDLKEIEREIYPSTGVARSGALVELANDLRRAAGQPRASLLLCVDQLEELLGHETAGEASRFLTFLRSALEDEQSPVRILGTLRSDFLGDFQGDPALRELAFESLTVGPMSVDGFAQIIEGPAALAGIELGPGLVQAMVADTATEDALPLLAFTLRELWEGYGEDSSLDVAEYRDQLGGLNGAVALAAESVLSAHSLSQTEEADLRAAFVAMVRINEEGQYVRRPVMISEVPASVQGLLERFVEARLLVAQGDGRTSRLEVAHEALLRSWDRLVSWLAEDRAFLLWRKRVEEARGEWERTKRHPQALLRGPALAEAAGWAEKRRDALSQEEQSFVGHSLSARRRRQRWRKAWLAATILVLLAFAVASHLQRRLIEKAMLMAHDTSVLNHARAMRDNKDGLAADILLDLHNPKLYLHSLNLEELHRQKRVLGKSRDAILVALKAEGGVDLQLILDSRWSVHLKHEVPAYLAAIEGSQGTGLLGELRSGRGRYMLTATTDLKVHLWRLPEVESVITYLRDAELPQFESKNVATGARLLSTFSGHSGKVSTMSLSTDGRYAVTTCDEQVALWRTDSGAEPLLLGGQEGAVTSAAFDPETQHLLTTSEDGSARLWSLKDVFAAPKILSGHREALVSGAFDHDGAKLLTLSNDGEIWLWQVATGKGSQVATANCESLEIAFSDVGTEAILACADGTARVFNAANAGEMKVLQ